MFYKPEHRKRIREERKQLKPQHIQQFANQVATQIIPMAKFLDSKSIAFYMPHNGELDPWPIIHSAAQLGKHFFLPVLHKNGEYSLEFYPYTIGDHLEKNQYDIEEPKTNDKHPVDISTLDIIFIPVVGFDKDGNRIGSGVGYYDRTLEFALKNPTVKRPVFIGLAYEFQKIDEITPNKWDIPMDFVVTEKHIYRR